MKNKRTIFFLTVIVILLLVIFIVYRSISFTIDTGDDGRELLIPTGSSYEEAMFIIDSVLDIKKPEVFHLIARKKNYPRHVNPGRYVVGAGITYPQLIDMLRSGKQQPVNVTFNNVKTLYQLAGKIGSRIEADSTEIIDFLTDESNYAADGFNKNDIMVVFIPNTYQMYWNTGAVELYGRMLKEYKSFWTRERLEKAVKTGLAQKEVAILASIVDEEVLKADEKPRIAGVYLNRLKKGIPLQADPTVKFALNDFTITRVLKKHLAVDSPYNTYKYRGLPPGPVSCPTIGGIEAVLNAEDHDYYYFVAKSDLSGYHNFSRTLTEHNRYASAYQRELNRRRIFK